MKNILLLATLTVVSCLVMIVVDYFLGAKAEFLNAFSVVERLLGRTPSVGDSFVAKNFGAAGEFAGVLVVNVVFGYILAILVKFYMGNSN